MPTTYQIFRTAKDGSYALALYRRMSDDTYEFIGYGLYSSNGEFLDFFPTEGALHERMNEIDARCELPRKVRPKP